MTICHSSVGRRDSCWLPRRIHMAACSWWIIRALGSARTTWVVLFLSPCGLIFREADLSFFTSHGSGGISVGEIPMHKSASSLCLFADVPLVKISHMTTSRVSEEGMDPRVDYQEVRFIGGHSCNNHHKHL